jgi:hypothetical protein
VERSRLTISVTRNEATFPASFALLFANSINNAAWNGFAKWTVKCNGITADKQFEESQIFYSVTYEFEVRSDDWRLKVYDAGLEQVDPDDATRTVKIKDKEGNPITEPRFLDGAGEVLPINADESDYVQLYFNGYPEEAFALLNITL